MTRQAHGDWCGQLWSGRPTATIDRGARTDASTPLAGLMTTSVQRTGVIMGVQQAVGFIAEGLAQKIPVELGDQRVLM